MPRLTRQTEKRKLNKKQKRNMRRTTHFKRFSSLQADNIEKHIILMKLAPLREEICKNNKNEGMV